MELRRLLGSTGDIAPYDLSASVGYEISASSVARTGNSCFSLDTHARCAANHNLTLLKQFYLIQQQKHYSNIIEKKFHQPQSKDTRYVHKPLNLPLIQIHIPKSNPDKDIKTTQPTIQIICDEAHIFIDIGNLLITIPKTRLEWLWKQYNINLGTQHHLDLRHTT
jgi:hypothetical protein